MSSKHLLVVLASVALIIYGYYLLAVPPDALYDEIVGRAKGGVMSVLGGGGLLMTWLALR